jgi:broad specificity phosphatase PhoE
MQDKANPLRIYLIRHATPDWNRKDIPYDVPPGPSLVPQGKQEALQVGAFLAKQVNIKKIYHSPLVRARQTAEISSQIANIPIQVEKDLAEWRTDESEEQLALRISRAWNKACDESRDSGGIALVSHGGPIRLVLQKLGLPPDVMEYYRNQFDHRNPLPPAGIWIAEKSKNADQWNLQLIFVPNTEK